MVEKSLEETTPGKRIAVQVMGPMVKAIEQAREANWAKLTDPKLKKIPDDMMILSVLPADVLAACTVLTALANPVEASYTSVAANVALRLRHELELVLWRRAEAAAEKDRKESKVDGINLYKLMAHRNKGAVDQRAFDKWRRKAELFERQEWSRQTSLRIGMALLALLVECDGWFKVENVWDPLKGQAKLTFGMTDTGLQASTEIDAQCEEQRPFMLPTICEPRDYEYIEPEVRSLPM